jgi:hypothetical protein
MPESHDMPLEVGVALSEYLAAVYTERTITGVIAALGTVLDFVAWRAIDVTALDVEASAATSHHEQSS